LNKTNIPHSSENSTSDNSISDKPINDKKTVKAPISKAAILLMSSLVLAACGTSSTVDEGAETEVEESELVDSDNDNDVSEIVDITNAIFTEVSADCYDYINTYEASVVDIQNSIGFESGVLISGENEYCSIISNAIPNHDFNDATASFASDVAEVDQAYVVQRNPQIATNSTAMSQGLTNAIMLNGVVLDLLSAGCYRPSDASADADGNVAIGCSVDDAWLLDPLGTEHKFGADAHNAHVQPGGLYHYHGNPNAMFDDNPGVEGSPVIGFAADGFPIYGSYFLDSNTGSVRKAVSGYTLKNGTRASSETDPGGIYDGMYVDDYEYTSAGDLDECNGMTVNGQYGYYVSDSYPWVMNCFSGTPDDSFSKAGDTPPEGVPAEGDLPPPPF